MLPSWIMKLAEGWGETKKNDSKGEDDGLKVLFYLLPKNENGGLSDRILNERSFRKKRLLCKLLKGARANSNPFHS